MSPFKRIKNDFTPQVDKLVNAYLQQIIIDSLAHADPHPGNVHLTPDNHICLMDIDMVARFTNFMKEQILKLLFALSKNDTSKIVSVLLNISKYDSQANIEEFTKQVNRLVLNYMNIEAKNLETGKLVIQMNRIAAENGIQVAVEMNILGKILLNMDQIIAVLAPDYNFKEAIEKFSGKIMLSKIKQDLKLKNFYEPALEFKDLLTHIPGRLNKISESLAQNQFKLKIDALDEKRLSEGFQKVANRITLGVIIASLIIGASMLMRIPSKHTLFGYPIFSGLLFVIAAIIAFYLIYVIIFKDNNFKNQR